MEGETLASVQQTMSFMHERILPTLENNIKSGNSLIDLDFYDGELEFTGTERKIKPFNWQAAFPEVFKRGGFDCVIGNPPWGAVLSPDELHYLKQKYKSVIVRMIDSYMYFLSRGNNLLDPNGYLGMIIPSTFLNQSDTQLLRNQLVNDYNITTVINLGDKVFGAKVLNTSTILIYSKCGNEDFMLVGDIRNCVPEEKKTFLNNIQPIITKSWIELVKKDASKTFFTQDITKVHLLNSLCSRFINVANIIEGEIQRGISPDYSKAFIVDGKTKQKKRLEKQILRPVALGSHLHRYSVPVTNEYIIYLTKDDEINDYPNTKSHLQEFK